MFIIGKNGNLMHYMGGKLYDLHRPATQVINDGLSCYFVSGNNICMHLSNSEYEVLMSTLEPPTIYRTLCSQGYLVAHFGCESWMLKPKIRVHGKLVYYSKEFYITQDRETYNLVEGDKVVELFPSSYNITFIDKVTPLNRTRLHIHAFRLFSGTLSEVIFWVDHNGFAEIYNNTRVVCAGDMSNFYVVPHKQVYIFTTDGYLLPNKTILQRHRVVDCALIEYVDGVTRLTDLREQ